MKNVKTFRRQITRGELSFGAISESRASIYGSYAHAMNEIENWTGEFHRIEAGQEVDIVTDYRFPTPAYICNGQYEKTVDVKIESGLSLSDK